MNNIDEKDLLKAHNIPPGIDPKWMWCCKDGDEGVWVYSEEPKYSHYCWDAIECDVFHVAILDDIFAIEPLANFTPENSLHQRVGDEWVHVPTETKQCKN